MTVTELTDDSTSGPASELFRIDDRHVGILVDGRIVASGGPDLATQPENEGYEAWR